MLNHAYLTVPTQPYDLDYTDQKAICPCLADLPHALETDYLPVPPLNSPIGSIHTMIVEHQLMPATAIQLCPTLQSSDRLDSHDDRRAPAHASHRNPTTVLFTEVHSKQDQIWLAKIMEYVSFYVDRRS